MNDLVGEEASYHDRKPLKGQKARDDHEQYK
jgi:hypothetical protein